MHRMIISVFLVVLAGCGSSSIFVGDTELSEKDLGNMLSGLPDTVSLISAHESDYCLKVSEAAYSELVVVNPGTVKISGRPHKNNKPVIIDINNEKFFAPGESRENGSDYFVYLLPAPVGKSFRVVISKFHPDWTGYFSPGAGKRPREYSPRTWILLGYFHLDPRGKVLKNSVTTNSNLDDPPTGMPLPGMVKVGNFAIDIYENSDLNGYSISAYGRTPLTDLTRDEAQLLANQSGKRLPTSRQWFNACDPETFPQVFSRKPQEGEGGQNTWSGQVALTGHFAVKSEGNSAMSGCVDMVGNVWEWCEEIMDLPAIEDMPTTTQGYITEYTTFRQMPFWPTNVNTKRPVESLGYFFLDESLGQACIARGASCDDGNKAGTASLRLDLTRQDSSPRVGLRCVR